MLRGSINLGELLILTQNWNRDKIIIVFRWRNARRSSLTRIQESVLFSFILLEKLFSDFFICDAPILSLFDWYIDELCFIRWCYGDIFSVAITGNWCDWAYYYLWKRIHHSGYQKCFAFGKYINLSSFFIFLLCGFWILLMKVNPECLMGNMNERESESWFSVRFANYWVI